MFQSGIHLEVLPIVNRMQQITGGRLQVTSNQEITAKQGVEEPVLNI